MSLEDPSDVAHVRTRPAMYIGTTGFFGLVHYFVSAVNLCLERSPSRIGVEVLGDCFRVRADVALAIERTASDELMPFEKFAKPKRGLGLDGPILNALSSQLEVSTELNGSLLRLSYERGRRTGESTSRLESTETVIDFSPDNTIFTVSGFSSYNFRSYLHRLSFLNPHVKFTFSDNGQSRTYHSPNGIRGMFDSVAAPYQILHEPVHFRHVDGDLDLEIVWGFHSWQGDVIWSFVNKGRAVEGGTHDQGLAAAFRALPKQIGMKTSNLNGVVAIMSIIYPAAVWEGCLKAKIGSKELRPLVRKTVVEQSLKWIDAQPRLREQMRELHRFHFPDVWIASR